MPTYEYACTACHDRFEVVQSFSDAALTECRECGGRLRKVFSPVGVVFKGSGFYKTDSRSSGTTTPSESKTETKPESKPSSDGGTATSAPSTAPAAAAS